MKKWLFAVGGVLLLVLAVFLIVIFAGKVLLFLEGIVGIIAGLAGAVVLFIAAEEIRSDRQMKKENERQKETKKSSASS